jgi:hypothetical protein
VHSPFVCEAVKLGIAPAFRFLPIRFDETSVFQAVQSGVERPARHLNNFTRDLLQPLGDGVAMHRLNGDDFQNQEI